MNLARALAEGFRARMNNSFNDMRYFKHPAGLNAWQKGWFHADRLINTVKGDV